MADETAKDLVPQLPEDTQLGELAGVDLQVISKKPIVGILEALTGLGANIANDKGSLVVSGGRLTQAIFSGRFRNQLKQEVLALREAGEIPDEYLQSGYSQSIFVKLMQIIDEESSDIEKLSALKSIFIYSLHKDTGEHERMLSYQYFEVCKKLKSIDILILKVAYEVYEEDILPSEKVSAKIPEWEESIADQLGIPRELVSQSRLENSPVSQQTNTLVFDAEGHPHGLTGLGIEIGKFIKDGTALIPELPQETN